MTVAVPHGSIVSGAIFSADVFASVAVGAIRSFRLVFEVSAGASLVNATFDDAVWAGETFDLAPDRRVRRAACWEFTDATECAAQNSCEWD